MKDYIKWHETAVKSALTAGQPRVRDYLMIKLADNGLTIVLVLFTLAFGYLGLFGPADSEGRRWTLNAASLCLGVFLGLFAGKKP